jgi:hypothetical protein
MLFGFKLVYHNKNGNDVEILLLKINLGHSRANLKRLEGFRFC